MSNALMMMAYGAYFMGGGDYTPNLISEPYFTESSNNWYSVSDGSTETHGQPDESGGNNAVKITFIGANNHQTWYDLRDSSGNPAPLTEGKAYTIKTWAKAGPEGFTNPYDIAYYSGGDSMVELEVNITSEWAEHEMRFIASDDPHDDPSIRLIGYGNGLDGESIIQGKTTLEEIEVSGDGSPIITENYITDSSSWQITSGLNPTFNVADSQGGTSATRFTLIGADGHHVEYTLSSPLVEGNAYTLSARMRTTAAGISETVQMAYYDDGSNVQGQEVSLTTTWQTFHFKFIARYASEVDPTIRLIGYGNGADGDEVEIEQVHLVEGTDPAI